MVAINKPHGLLVHRSTIANDAELFAIQLLRDQIGQRVYPVHRLDRKTGGVLLFALNPDIHGAFSALFRESKVSKTYLAIVRGYTDDQGTIDYPLKNDRGKVQDAVTHYTIYYLKPFRNSLCPYKSSYTALQPGPDHSGDRPDASDPQTFQPHLPSDHR